MSASQFCTFFLGTFFLGVEVEKVQEAIRYQKMTRVPLAHPAVKGLINLRGQIVTALDLKERLQLQTENDDSGKLPMNVVIRNNEAPVSLLVDEVGDVIEVEEEFFEEPPQTLEGPIRELIRGAYKLKDRLLLVLDTDKTLHLEETEKSAELN